MHSLGLVRLAGFVELVSVTVMEVSRRDAPTLESEGKPVWDSGTGVDRIREDTSGSLEWTALVVAVAIARTRWQCLAVIAQE